MARRNSYPGGKWYQRPDQAYARTAGWPTRYYQRKVTGSMVAALSGLNTTSLNARANPLISGTLASTALRRNASVPRVCLVWDKNSSASQKG